MVFIYSLLVTPAYIGHNYHFDIGCTKHLIDENKVRKLTET